MGPFAHRRHAAGAVLSLSLSSLALLATAQCGAGADDSATTPSVPGVSDQPREGGAEPGPIARGDAAGAPKPSHACTLGADDNAPVAVCSKSAPAGAFTPKVKWKWSTKGGSITTPLVGHFVDTNGDGRIDLCDTPNVLALAAPNPGSPNAKGTFVVLGGADGAVLRTFPGNYDANISPAFGDIDGDGLSDVIAVDLDGRLTALTHEGAVKWQTASPIGVHAVNASQCAAIAIYDLDADGSPEILAGFEVFDAKGARRFGVAGDHGELPQGAFWCPTPIAADLDGDGKLEVIFGRETFHHDGTLYWSTSEHPGQPHVADLDGDQQPDVLIATDTGVTLYAANGTKKFGPVRPTQQVVDARCWGKPGAIHDFDGDGKPDFAMGSCTDYSVYTISATGLVPKWSKPIGDPSGLATGTGFDFLGRGIADAMYADETTAYVFDGRLGTEEMRASRTSQTLVEYPVVADVDDDGSADVVIVSNGAGAVDAVTVYEDAQRRWIPARRVWNQEAYHVTNVREDGTIPRVMAKSWTKLNTFRTNTQIEGTGDCAPPPPPPPK